MSPAEMLRVTTEAVDDGCLGGAFAGCDRLGAGLQVVGHFSHSPRSRPITGRLHGERGTAWEDGHAIICQKWTKYLVEIWP